MPESQLKRLKASLRTAGITRQQKSKKSAKKSATKNDSRLDRNVALQSIREEFNPFEVKTNRVKHNVLGRGVVKGAQGRPGLSKQIGEENVRIFPSCRDAGRVLAYWFLRFRGRERCWSRCSGETKSAESWIGGLERTTRQ